MSFGRELIFFGKFFKRLVGPTVLHDISFSSFIQSLPKVIRFHENNIAQRRWDRKELIYARYKCGFDILNVGVG